jgi:hypothetical protein
MDMKPCGVESALNAALGQTFTLHRLAKMRNVIPSVPEVCGIGCMNFVTSITLVVVIVWA